MRRMVTLLLWSAAGVAVLVVLSFLALSPLVKHLLMTRLSSALHREVSVESVRINPFTLSLTLKGFLVKDRDSAEPFVSFEELYLNVQGSSVFRRAVILKEIRLHRPALNITRRRDRSYNFSDLLPAEGAKPASPPRPLQFSLNNIQIVDAGIDFVDEPVRVRHVVRDATASVPFISNIPYHVETFVEPRLEARINDTQYVLEGKTKPFAESQETEFDINVADLDIPYYLAYLPVQTRAKLVSAFLDAKLRLSFIQRKEGASSLTLKGDVTLKRVALNDAANKTLLRLPRLEISAAHTEPLAGVFHLTRVLLDSPALFVRRGRDGTINVAALGLERSNAAKPDDAAPGPRGRTVQIDELDVANGTLSFSDLSVAAGAASVTAQGSTSGEPATLAVRDLRLRAERLSTQDGSEGTVRLSLVVGEKGRVVAKGAVGMSPLAARLALDVRDLDVRPIQPYLAGRVNLALSKGTVTTGGQLSVGSGGAAGLKVGYQGNALLSRFSSVDLAQGQEFLTWESLSLGELDLGYNPTHVRIKTVALTDFYARVVIQADGSVNLQHVLASPDGEEAPVEVAAARPSSAPGMRTSTGPSSVGIQTVTLQGGRINFTDRSLKPSYSANLVDIAGKISGLSSAPDTVADLELRGKLDRYAPLEIRGQINPLREDVFADVKATFKDMELSPMTPYSGKFVGYTIQKGKLSFDVTYQIVEKKLDARNNVFLDQLEFGERIESPTATNLPVRLAVALLKDRNGEIRLDLPVAGRLDDPEFRVGKVIVQIIVNLISKAATAPFALLGMLLGAGEELSYVEFEDGNAVLSEGDAKKLDRLVAALHERPALKLEVEAHVDRERDRTGLQRAAFARKVKLQKFNDRVRQGLPVVSVDELTIELNEYEKYLAMAYRAEKFPKPRNFLGLVKSLPAPEMEKLMLAHLEINDEHLRALASQRAMAVKEMILASGKVEPGRVFVVQPKSLEPEPRENVGKNRVDFRLR